MASQRWRSVNSVPGAEEERPALFSVPFLQPTLMNFAFRLPPYISEGLLCTQNSHLCSRKEERERQSDKKVLLSKVLPPYLGIETSRGIKLFILIGSEVDPMTTDCCQRWEEDIEKSNILIFNLYCRISQGRMCGLNTYEISTLSSSFYNFM